MALVIESTMRCVAPVLPSAAAPAADAAARRQIWRQILAELGSPLPDLALDILATLARTAPDHPEVLLLTAQVQLEQEQLPEAQKTADRCVLVDPKLADCWLTLGVLRQNNKDNPGAIAAYEEALARFLPVDEQGSQINAIIDWLEAHPEVTRVSEVADAVGLSERGLQRLVVDRVGLTPKWLIQRRRLHDAVARLKAGDRTLADLAAELGYTDQAHFTICLEIVSFPERTSVHFTSGYY